MNILKVPSSMGGGLSSSRGAGVAVSCIRSFTSIGRLHYGSGRLILPSSYSSQISVTLDLGSKILFWTAAGTATLAEKLDRGGLRT